MVFLFSQSGAADERATRHAVRALKRRGRLAVFSDRAENLGRYGPLVLGTGISQAPAVVIVGRDREARVLEGFVDRGSLRQHIKDAAG